MRAGVAPVTGFPSSRISPPEGLSSPMMHFRRVLLPAPLAPTRATVCPAATAMSMPKRAWAAP